jgi:hypothetical protein
MDVTQHIDVELHVTTVTTTREAATHCWSIAKAVASHSEVHLYTLVQPADDVLMAGDSKVSKSEAVQRLLKRSEDDYFSKHITDTRPNSDKNVVSVDLDGRLADCVQSLSKYYGPESKYYAPVLMTSMLPRLVNNQKKIRATAFFKQLTSMQRLTDEKLFRKFLLSYSYLFNWWTIDTGTLPPGLFFVPTNNTLSSMMQTDRSTVPKSLTLKRKEQHSMRTDQRKRARLDDSDSKSQSPVGVLSPATQQRRTFQHDTKTNRQTELVKKKSLQEIIESGNGFFSSEEELPEKSAKGTFWKYQTLVHDKLPGAVVSQNAAVIWCACSKLFFDSEKKPSNVYKSFCRHVDTYHPKDKSQLSLAQALQKYKPRPKRVGSLNEPVAVDDDDDDDVDDNDKDSGDDSEVNEDDSSEIADENESSDNNHQNNAESSNQQRQPATRDEAVHNLNMGLHLVQSGKELSE